MADLAAYLLDRPSVKRLRRWVPVRDSTLRVADCNGSYACHQDEQDDALTTSQRNHSVGKCGCLLAALRLLLVTVYARGLVAPGLPPRPSAFRTSLC